MTKKTEKLPAPAPAKPRPIALTDDRLIVVIHHTAANDAFTDTADLMNERRHRNEGYNVIIDDDDIFTEGPAAGKDGEASVTQDAPDTGVSNGVYGSNWRAVNICIDGNFETARPTDDEVNALVQVIAAKAKRWGWNKADTQTRIMGHQEAGRRLSPTPYGTACPGKNLIARIPEIRNRVAAYLPE
jgi:hypothetical protein